MLGGLPNVQGNFLITDGPINVTPLKNNKTKTLGVPMN
jgi:hypothetical protein